MAITASRVVLIYFVIGAVMYGGGAIAYDESGITTEFVDNTDSGVQPNNETENKVQGVSGAITNLIGLNSGPVLLVWNLVTGLVGFIHWPLTVLMVNNAPPTVIILLGGTPTVMFYMALVRLVKSSA